MLKKIIIGIILNGGALYGVTYFLPEIQYTGGLKFFAIGGIVMGILNSVVKPILKLLTLPLQILTLGLSLIILNGIIFWIFDVVLDSIVIEGVTMMVQGITAYAFAGLIFGALNWLEHLVIHNK